MDERKIKILNSIISSYIESKEPVGSRSLSKGFDIGVSAATIRNEMSDLEELGYLEKLHTSSGRVPSNRGYRLYVDKLLSDEIPFTGVTNQIFDMRKLKESSEFNEVIRNATKMLSAVTNYTAVALIPELNNVRLKYINVVMLSPRDLVVVYIYNSKAVHSDIIRLKAPTDQETIDLVNSILSSTLLDLNYEEIVKLLHSGVYNVLKNKHLVLNSLIPVIGKTNIENGKSKIVYEGLGNVFVYNKADLDENQEIITILKDDKSIEDLLVSNMDSLLQVYIGEEIGVEGLENFSIITTTFRNRQGLKGKIGVIGPNSMRYDKVIADIMLINKYINGHIERK